MSMKSLNQAYTRLGMARRYESWFLRFGLSDGSGAWWLRYLLTNPAREGCSGPVRTAPGQVWATWFPRDGHPQSFIQGFPIESINLGPRDGPFCLRIGSSQIEDASCRGSVEGGGLPVSWNVRYNSNFGITVSNKGWIGFSRTPHSDATFFGEIRLGDRIFHGNPLGIGVQGHNCGFRHRHFWTWMHACFPQSVVGHSTFEAIVYEMPFGLIFRKAILWHGGRAIVFRRLRQSLRDQQALVWNFAASSGEGSALVSVEGGGPSLHRLPYVKTDCTGTFEVSNNSRARALIRLDLRSCGEQQLVTEDGAVLEMTGTDW